jgi:hypothetical protein
MPSSYQVGLWKQRVFRYWASSLEVYLFDQLCLAFKRTAEHYDTWTLAARSTMLNALPAPILLDIAIIFTALSWGLGLYLVDKRVHIFASLAVGCFVCLFGYSVESLGAPPWAVVAAPVPLDLLLLWYILRKPRKMAVAYVSIWAIYIVIHILLSAFLSYDSLIPAWRVHS